MKAEIIKKLAVITDEEKEILKGDTRINRNLYMKDEKNVINSKKLLTEGKLITIRPHTRFIDFPLHKHDYIELVYMCQGTTKHIINRDKITLSSGELLFLSQNAEQEILAAGENDIAVNFIILPEFFNKTISMLENEESPLKKFIIDCLLNQNSETAYLHFKVSDILPVQNLIENLVWTLLESVQNKRSIHETTMGLLLLQLISYTDRLAYKSPEEELIITVLRYIEEHYRDGSLRELCQSLHYDFAWLSREIKRKTGKTYTALLQEKRMSQAGYLLRNTDINVEDIALQVGYENISYFHRLFYNTYNKTPREYRIFL